MIKGIQVGLAYRAFRNIYMMHEIGVVEDRMETFVELYPVEVLEGVRNLAELVLEKVSCRPDYSLSRLAVFEVIRLGDARGELCKYLHEIGHPYPQPEVSIELPEPLVELPETEFPAKQ